MSNRYSCPDCEGQGILITHDPEDGQQVNTICEDCDGNGYIDPTLPLWLSKEAFWVVLLIPNVLLWV